MTTADPATFPHAQDRVAEALQALGAVTPAQLASAALASSRRLVTGLDLLVHQAALQFAQFTGQPAPLAAMRVAGESALAER